MDFIADRVLDNGLSVLTSEANRLDICSSKPTTFVAATTTASLGNKTSISIGSPEARSPDGRRVTVAQITEGEVTAESAQTGAYFAITDTVNSRLLVVGDLESSRVLNPGDTWNLPPFDIGIPGAV